MHARETEARNAADGAEEDAGRVRNREEGRLIGTSWRGCPERWVQDHGYTVKPHPPDRQGWVSHKGAQNQTIQLSHFIGRCPYLRFPEVDAVYFLLSTLSHYFSKH